MLRLSCFTPTRSIIRQRIFSLISYLAILSLLLASFPPGLIAPVRAAGARQAAGEPTYRANIILQHPYDATRLAQLGLTLQQDGQQTLVFATKAQLATLARRGFQPSGIMETSALSQLAGGELNPANLIGIAALDSDADGLTDQEEEWWCTNPADSNSDSPLLPSGGNPSDGAEAQAILNGITAYGPPFALWPRFTPYNAAGTCPDGDFDGVPDLAEELIIGTSPLRESSDKDKFDDGQELFGVTFCPGSSGPCGYGILPRAEDAAFVSANLPSWVLPPGKSPWVAAFPEPEVEVVPSSIKITAKTTIETERTITEGEEHTYGTAKTKGASTSLANTITWNEWQEISRTEFNTTIMSQSGLTAQGGFGEEFEIDSASLASFELQSDIDATAQGAACGLSLGCIAGNINANVDNLVGEVQANAVSLGDIANNRLVDLKNSFNNILSDSFKDIKILSGNNLNINIGSKGTGNIDRNVGGNGTDISAPVNGGSNDPIIIRPYFEMKYPVTTSSTSTSNGTSRGGAKTTTTTEYEEQTISEASTNQFSEAWSDATAIDTAHAADLRFTYNIVNNGTEYAREVTSLLFNIYIGDTSNPAYTYVAVGPTGQVAQVENLFPDETLTFTSNPIALTLDEMQAIDQGAPIRIVMEDIAYGQDQVFYQDALNGSVRVAMEDGFNDRDESIDTYLIPVWDPSDTVQDVLKRYFPAREDTEGDLLSISTPEFNTNPPTFNEYTLTGTSWWNIYMSEELNYTGDFKNTLAKPNTTVLVRLLSDRDLDGYNDRSEIRLGTNPDDPASHPNPELLAGYTTTCSGNDCTVLMSFLNTGNYDAYGIEAIMYSPDGLAAITNNTIGGSGRVPAGEQVVLGTRILSPDLKNWTGGAQPFGSGFYLGDVDRTYTFTAQVGGFIGSGSLPLAWTDGQGGSGTVNFGAGYEAPLPLTIAQGVQLGFQSGSVNAGESFTVQALTPRDTFQYTLTNTNAISPVVVVSYNDPQGNHRFILPSASYPAGAQLPSLNSNLQPLSGKMLLDPGVDISATDKNQAQFILNAPHTTPITNSHLFVEYIDSQGSVAREDVFTQTLQTGPSIIPLTVDLNTFDPDEYILLAFFTDSQGNIIDSSARPLASFGPDPLPLANLTAGDWQVGTLSIMSVPDPWDFGTVEAGTLLSARLTLANSGKAGLQYTLTGLGSGVSVEGSPAGVLGPAQTRVFNLRMDTAGLPAGVFFRSLTLRTNDPLHATIPINLAGIITGGSAGSALAHQVNPFRPWDQYVTVSGPRNLDDIVTFNHTISDVSAQMNPLYLYNEDGTTLRGVGEFGVGFNGQTPSSILFGTGGYGDLTVGTGQTLYANDARANLTGSASAGQPTVIVSSTAGWVAGDEVMIIQMTGSGSGNYEFGTIASWTATSFTLEENLHNTYTVNANSKAQALLVRHYKNVTILGTLTAYPWDGTTGGVAVFRVSQNMQIASTGNFVFNQLGFQGGTGRNLCDNCSAWQASGHTGAAPSISTNANGNGGGGSHAGGGNGGAGGGGHALPGQNGGGGQGAQGGQAVGNAELTTLFMGGGGGGGHQINDPDPLPKGGNGGGIVALFAKDIAITGTLTANGGKGDDANTHGGSLGAGGGAGGSIYLVGSTLSIGSNKVSASGGNPGVGTYSGSQPSGRGSEGRIRIQYCDSLSGSTNPVASTQKLNCYRLSQIPGLPDNDTQLLLPDQIGANNTFRYLAQYGQRSTDTSGGNQLFSVRLPNRKYSQVNLSALVERVAGSGSSFNFCLDLGNNGVCDWTPPAQTFSGPVRLDTSATAAITLTTALNAYIQAQASSAPSLLVPIRVNVNTPADIFLFNLMASPGQDVDLAPLTLSLTPSGGAPLDGITAGTPVTLTTTISNSGVYTAENFLVTFREGEPITDSVLIGSTFIEALKPGITRTLTQTWDTSGLLGLRTLWVQVDSANTLPESSEINNTRSATATILTNPGSGVNVLTVDVGGSGLADPAYDPALGYGWLTEGSVVNSCGTTLDKTYRQASSVDSLKYRFDHLLPNRFYHLDLTFKLCSGSDRWVNLFVDGEQVGETAMRLVGSQNVTSTRVTTVAQTVSVLLNPASYADGTVDLSVERATGLAGPLLNIIDLREVRYCYLDSGPGEQAWSAVNGCGHNLAQPSDVFDGWGDLPEETIRFNEAGQVQYKFTDLDPTKKYNLGMTFHEEDGLARQQEVRFDSELIQTLTLDSNVQRFILPISTARYSDRQIIVTIKRTTGSSAAIVSEVALEENTRRYSGPPPLSLLAAAPFLEVPRVEFSSFTAVPGDTQIDIAWSTVTEVNNGAFTILRSTDAQSWQAIHTQASARPCGEFVDTGPVTYSFADSNISSNRTYYYRLLFSGETCGIGQSIFIQTAQVMSDFSDYSIYLPVISKQ